MAGRFVDTDGAAEEGFGLIELAQSGEDDGEVAEGAGDLGVIGAGVGRCGFGGCGGRIETLFSSPGASGGETPADPSRLVVHTESPTRRLWLTVRRRTRRPLVVRTTPTRRIWR